MAGHDEFLELCAVSLAGEITDNERKKLDEHLSACPSCRTALHQYHATAVAVVPQLASELPPPIPSVDSTWIETEAEAALFARLKAEDRCDQPEDTAPTGPKTEGNRFVGFVPPPPRWKHFGMLYAAGILLFVSLAICAYRIGERRGSESAAVSTPSSGMGLAAAESELNNAGHDRQVLLTEIAARDRAIAGLRQEIARESAAHDIGAGKQVQSAGALGPAKDGMSTEAQKGTTLSGRIEQLQERLDSQERARSEQAAQSSALEAKVVELSKQLQDRNDVIAHQDGFLLEHDDLLQQRDKTIARQQGLLAHDRDIRDLMSARDLYIAEVYDVAKTGETNKPYGRVFYTKGKSLLFYAYDLDQQAGLKNASTFQAWGRRGTSQEQPVSLGILFEDSVANKRWVVRSEDSKTLEQIDAVFVTVEPNGGSHRPSGKPLLFAYLRIHPNHP